jgi:hypothetical protein
MKYLILLLLPFSAISVEKHDATLCRAVKNDNYILVLSKLEKPASDIDTEYKKYHCNGESILSTAEDSPETKKRLLRKLSYLTIGRDGREVNH